MISQQHHYVQSYTMVYKYRLKTSIISQRIVDISRMQKRYDMAYSYSISIPLRAKSSLVPNCERRVACIWI
jgi:hypothetical protein